ncbi:ABC transporter substrate-binding protein [Roseomonas hellenica]|uniref:ABC transporter substrate-binding protein n=1 Tax=Plastoroseomonas hellenica TaxID=2687306 RepID=A0ABS5F001_9PROT|nr:ABC transporter substrate-binding protein [Plastoroseomonas hellenica]MBR0665875.1 ABC transporter substrate-binding protein [Plastoroseomonas hellenica]
MQRRHFLAAATSLAAAHSLARPAYAQGAAKVLRVIPAANLTSLDPIWTTAPATKNHGYLVYDQIAAVDAEFVPRPQMAEGWEIGDDGRSWTFMLREGLRFHDGEPVRSADCIASIRRWWARDVFGQVLASQTDDIEALDDRRFRFRLKRPFPMLAAALGKSNSSQCFIMPERIARTDPGQQITDPTGSGPFRFLREQWVAGVKAVYAKHEAYVPRSEPVSSIAGGRVARVDRIEWTVIPDAATAAAALRTGEQDYWDQAMHDLLPSLRRDRNIVVEPRDRSGTYAMLRFNHLQAPFNNPAIRQAVAMAVDQSQYMQAVAGNEPGAWGTCEGFFACSGPMASEAGNAVLKTRSIERAQAALRAAGYNGEKVVQIAATDSAPLTAVSEVTADLLRRMGFNLDYVASDWGSMLQRRNSREPVERGGWSVFHTVWNGADILSPAVNTLVRANGGAAWFGWPSDPELETLRNAWFEAPDLASQQAVVQRLQEQAFRSMPYVPLGYYVQPAAWRRNVTGVFPVPTTVYWNIGKSD